MAKSARSERTSPSNRLTVTDLRRAGYCVGGIQLWCRAYGHDFRDFVKNGAPLETAETVQDVLVQRAVRLKKERAGG